MSTDDAAAIKLAENIESVNSHQELPLQDPPRPGPDLGFVENVLSLRNLSPQIAQRLATAMNRNYYLRARHMIQSDDDYFAGTLATFRAVPARSWQIFEDTTRDGSISKETGVIEELGEGVRARLRGGGGGHRGYKKKRSKRKSTKRKSTRRKSTKRRKNTRRRR